MGLGEVRACHVVFLGLVVIGGIYWYRKQAPERRERIKEVTFDIGSRLMDQFEMAMAEVPLERVQIHACVVPSPGRRTPVSAILRELAMSGESLSPQQSAALADVRDPCNDSS